WISAEREERRREPEGRRSRTRRPRISRAQRGGVQYDPRPREVRGLGNGRRPARHFEEGDAGGELLARAFLHTRHVRRLWRGFSSPMARSRADGWPRRLDRRVTFRRVRVVGTP